MPKFVPPFTIKLYLQNSITERMLFMFLGKRKHEVLKIRT